MDRTGLILFFFLALLCVGLSITNYLNISIIGKSNALGDFNGNRAGFLDMGDQSTVISTFKRFNEPIYNKNALTVEGSPANIQILNSDNTKHHVPILNVSNNSTRDASINFGTNDSSGTTPTGSIDITSDDNGPIEVDFHSVGHLRFNKEGNVFGTGMFNFAPYLDRVVTVPTTSDGWFRYGVKSNTTYLIPRNIYDGGGSSNNSNAWYFLPTDKGVTPGDHINFVFTGIASIINDDNRKIAKWGPPGAIAENSFIDNWGIRIKRMKDIPGDVTHTGIQQNTSGNNHLTGYFDFSQLNNSSTNNTPAGTLVQFSALDTNPIKWAVELDTVQPMCHFYFENSWHPGGTTNHEI